MRNCEVNGFNIGSWVTDKEYILYTPVEKMPYTPWTNQIASGTAKSPTDSNQHTSCNYPIAYSVKWRNYYDTTLDISTLQGILVWWETAALNPDGGYPAFWI